MQYVDSRLDAAVERMITLCRLCSVATEGAEAAEQRARAEMFVEELRGIGFSAGVRDTPGPPIVVGHDRRSRGPSVLFCGHYDAWPARLLRDERKGEATQSASTVAANPYNAGQSTQLMAFLEACRAWKAVAGQLPTPVSVLVVGERRSGSVRLTSILRMYADELNANIGIAPAARISCYAVPTINSMLRGLCCEGFTIVAADRDQLARPRSGASADPSRILARIIGDLQDQSGCVAIPGFYDGVDASLRPPLAPPGGEHGAGLVETIPVWPTCEIDSVSGSRNDGGRRRVFSPRAFARLSFHLVCDQDPDVIRLAFRDFARARVPSDCQIEFFPGSSIHPVRFAISHPAFGKAQDALTTEWGRQAVYTCGDAAPAIYALREALGMEVIVTSFPNDNCFRGSPREIPELASYRLGIHSWACILDALSR
jgi:acetylornithine deacetylase/succinyl-diaminopimelate desuccinylase-like protein